MIYHLLSEILESDCHRKYCSMIDNMGIKLPTGRHLMRFGGGMDASVITNINADVLVKMQS